MNTTTHFKRRALHVAVVAALLQMAAPVFADQAVDLGSVGATGGTGKTVDVNSAVYQAPTQTSLVATQPQSIISQHYIEENAAAGANYSEIISISPSVVDMAPNGPGLMESGGGGGTPTIRGFQDGQYNVTFDGIPWGDSNDFTHHSTVYFMPQDMGQIIVDRGPGDASTIGDATYGGTIAISSKAPSVLADTTIFGTYGSWNTRLLGAQYNSGINKDANDSSMYFSLKNLNSDGFLTNSGQSRNNAFYKFEKLATDNTVLTVVAMYNHTTQHVPNGSTPQQQSQYGYNFGLVNNVQSESNSGFNYDDLSTDFEYVGLKSHMGKWTLDNKLYTYAYYHNGFYGANTGSVTLQDTINDGGTANGPSNVPGAQMHNNYRSIGDILRATYNFGQDKLQMGFWADRQQDDRFEQQIDWTLGGAPNNIVTKGVYSTTAPGSVDRSMLSNLNSIQGYAQYVWKITPDWEVTPGVKYDSFTRTMNAAVNQKTLVPYTGSETWDKVLKSLNTRYAINPNLSAYAQYSEGFLAPNMNVFYKSGVDLSTVNPTTTKNYQIGTNWVSNKLNFGVDYYRIDANNLATGIPCPGGSGFTNCATVLPSVTYSGVELEATYMLFKGLSVYGNFARNNYSDPSGKVLQNAPTTNAAFGLIHQDGNLYASLVTKYIGDFYSNVDVNGNNLRLNGYAITNFDMSYKFEGKYKVGLGVYNLFDKTGNLTSINSDANGNPLFYVIPNRSYQVNFSAPF